MSVNFDRRVRLLGILEIAAGKVDVERFDGVFEVFDADRADVIRPPAERLTPSPNRRMRPLNPESSEHLRDRQ